jgi:NAD(P)-dependent dehydrogenase (short-subunit alcohol dehydrogenase family)
MGSRLSGKVAVITGAGSGIGEAAALMFAAEGAAVAVVDRDEVAAERVARQIEGLGGRAVAVVADVTNQDDTERMVGEAAKLGTVTVLYANAGIAGPGMAGNVTLEEWQTVIAVNLTGVWLSCRAVLPHMIAASGGSIINQASVGGLIGVPGIASYAAAKAGVIGLTRQMAVDYGPYAIRVNAICPGTIPTPLVERTWAQGAGLAAAAPQGEAYQELLVRAQARFPLGRLGTVNEVAALALHLASDESGWTTGTAIPVDGGMTAW